MDNSPMSSAIPSISEHVCIDAVKLRQEFHRYPELGWTEFRTASRAADILAQAGWNVAVGSDVCAPEERMGVPDAQALEAAREAALANGGDARWIKQMGDGLTAVVATLDGARPGPTIGLRFDMDALPIHEEEDPSTHRPAREGFRSIRRGIMHACGHDAHTAIGVAVGRALAALKSRLAGTIKILLQPAEEGTRGAASMVNAGTLDDVDYLLCPHVGTESDVAGEVVPGVTGFLATEKLDVTFRGKEAHAGLAPEEGRNALMGAAHAALALHGLPRHSSGNSRVSVGTLNAGSGRNIIPAFASMQVELRGENNDVLDYLTGQTRRVIEGSASMWGLESTVDRVGLAPSASSHPELTRRIESLARQTPGVTQVGEPIPATASDDATAMMQRVHQRGGQAAYVLLGTPLPSGHHTPQFDVDEQCIVNGIHLFVSAVIDISNEVDV